jgi:CheY-like chemotaxis protein
MDLDMPVMDGAAAMRALRIDLKTCRIPIIVLTAHASPEDVEQALRTGCQAYETKPIVIRRLLERIEAALAPARALQQRVSGGLPAMRSDPPAAQPD